MSGTKCNLSAVQDSQEHTKFSNLSEQTGAMQYSQLLCLNRIVQTFLFFVTAALLLQLLCNTVRGLD